MNVNVNMKMMKAPHLESRPTFGRRRSSALPGLMAVLFVVCLVLAGCKALDGYTRSYTLAAVDKFGQRVEVGMTLTPRQALEVANELQRREDAGVITKGARLTPDADPVPMEDAAEVLQILTAADEVKREGDRQAGSPTNAVRLEAKPPGDAVEAPMTYLTREGKLRLETHPAVIARYRAAGWRDAPRPGGGVWRGGKWVVMGAAERARLLEKPSTLNTGGRHD